MNPINWRQFAVLFDTQANVEARTDVSAWSIALATDRGSGLKFGYFNGTTWEWVGGGGGGAVDSVNSQTGVVVLDQDDIGDGATYKQYSATEKTKLSGIETAADVTDIGNVGAALNGASADTPLDADTFHFWDAVDSIIRKITWENIKAAFGAIFLNQNLWVSVSASWSYASASTITVPSDATVDYSKGVKIRFKQGGGYKYYVGYPTSSTVLAVIVNTDFTVANAAITDIAISYGNPPDFPEYFNYAATFGGTGVSIGNGTITAKYVLLGRRTIFPKVRVTGGSTTNWGSGFFNFSIPVDCAQVVGLSGLESAAGNILDTSASVRYAIAAFVRTSDMRGIYGNTILLQGSPITFATGDEINLSAPYEW